MNWAKVMANLRDQANVLEVNAERDSRLNPAERAAMVERSKLLYAFADALSEGLK